MYNNEMLKESGWGSKNKVGMIEENKTVCTT